MTSAAETRLELRRTLDAPPREVFEAWTRPETIRQWFAPGPMTVPLVEVDLRPGGRYRIAMREPDGTQYVATGTYEEVVPDERLVFTWTWEGGDGEQTLVTVSLAERDGKTELLLVHERFATAASRSRHLDGWNGCLDKLAQRLGRFRGGER